MWRRSPIALILCVALYNDSQLSRIIVHVVQCSVYLVVRMRNWNSVSLTGSSTESKTKCLSDAIDCGLASWRNVDTLKVFPSICTFYLSKFKRFKNPTWSINISTRTEWFANPQQNQNLVAPLPFRWITRKIRWFFTIERLWLHACRIPCGIDSIEHSTLRSCNATVCIHAR